MDKPLVVFCFFTYGQDLEFVRVSAAHARKFVPRSQVYIFDDAQHPVTEEGAAELDKLAVYRKTTFPRNGNLNGKDCVLGIHEAMGAALEESGSKWVFKLDSDTLITRALLMDLVNVAQVDALGFSSTCDKFPWRAYGCCYGYRDTVAAKIRKLIARWFRQDMAHNRHLCRHFEEDLVFSSVLEASDIPFGFADIDKGKATGFLQAWNYAEGATLNPRCRAFNVGNVNVLPHTKDLPRDRRRALALEVLKQAATRLA